MKRYSKGPQQSETKQFWWITPDMIFKYLKGEQCEEGTLTDARIHEMSEKIADYLVKEEHEYGEPYDSLEDADIPTLCEASDDLRIDYWNLLFGPEQD